MPPENIHIGTSGWDFDSWKKKFYPAGTGTDELLETYAETFETVELNNSFYRLPGRENIRDWCGRTPENFRFACKASRYITHMKKLKDPQEGIDRLMNALDAFEDKLGPVLFQLPPDWHVNARRLAEFLEALPEKHRYTFEFRDRSWLCGEIYELLKRHEAALCFYDYKGYRSPEIPTADFIYIRLHGPETRAYEGSYDGRTLAGYAQKFQRWAEDEGREVYCYFDNDRKARAPFDAQKLMKSVKRRYES